MAFADPAGPGTPRTGGEHLPRPAHAAGLAARLSGNPVAQGCHAVSRRPPPLSGHRPRSKPKGRWPGAIAAGTGTTGARFRAADTGTFLHDRPGAGHLPEIRTHRRSTPSGTQGDRKSVV